MSLYIARCLLSLVRFGALYHLNSERTVADLFEPLKKSVDSLES